MNVALWIIAVILAVAFTAAGTMKATAPRAKLEAQMRWVNDFSDQQVKGIGALELLGGLGLILPTIGDVAPILVPLAATGLALVMLGALIYHVRKHDSLGETMPSVVLGLLAVFVAIGRFGPQSF